MKRTKIEIRGRELPVCSHVDCERHTVWDFGTCYKHLTVSEQNTLRDRVATALRSGGQLGGLVLSDAELHGLDFSGADLSDCFLDGCNLSRCSFVETNLRRAFFGGANVMYADLTRAEIHGAVFTGAKLGGVRLLAYSLSNGRHPINLYAESFQTSALRRPTIDESSHRPSQHTYRALKTYFVGLGDYDSASWAAFSERRMERQSLWDSRRYGSWLGSMGFGLTTGYGERPARVISFALAIVVAYAMLYCIAKSLVPQPLEWLAWFAEALYFSVSTFCTFSAPLISLADNPVSRVLVATEAFIGVFTMGLFVFTLTRRYVSR